MRFIDTLKPQITARFINTLEPNKIKESSSCLAEITSFPFQMATTFFFFFKKNRTKHTMHFVGVNTDCFNTKVDGTWSWLCTLKCYSYTYFTAL